MLYSKYFFRRTFPSVGNHQNFNSNLSILSVFLRNKSNYRSFSTQPGEQGLPLKINPENKIPSKNVPVGFIPWSKRISNRLSLLDNTDFEAFMDEFPSVSQDLVSKEELKEMKECNEHMRAIAEYNVPDGKLVRPCLLVAMAKAAQKRTLKELPNLYRIAWAYEFFQASAILIDDIVDESKRRRDRPCSYLAHNSGLASVFDGFLLENACFILTRQYTKDNYVFHNKIFDLILASSFKGYYGQMLDSRIAKTKSWDTCSAEKYYSMMTFKNGFQAFSAPMLIGLLLNDINDPEAFKLLEKLGLDFGHFYSVQDDFVDCFVKEDKSGKIGTDIQNGKPSWLIITAFQKANEEQRKKLMTSYGKDDLEHATVVKRIYEEIGLPRIYSEYEKETYRNLMFRIDALPLIVPKSPLRKILTTLFGRTR